MRNKIILLCDTVVLTLWITWYILFSLQFNNRAVVPLMGPSLTGAERATESVFKAFLLAFLSIRVKIAFGGFI